MSVRLNLEAFGTYKTTTNERKGTLYSTIWNTVFTFVCFGHCAKRYHCLYRQLFCSVEPVHYPTYCPNDRAL
jgi:hypothetical protein